MQERGGEDDDNEEGGQRRKRRPPHDEGGNPVPAPVARTSFVTCRGVWAGTAMRSPKMVSTDRNTTRAKAPAAETTIAPAIPME